jgi:hypothetical protein
MPKHKKTGKRLVTWTICALLVRCLAADFHVSPSGSNEADGSENTPLKTLAAAALRAGPGDIVWIHKGVYRETLRPVRSGQPDAPITFAAVPEEFPVITGCEPVKEWHLSKNGFWTATVDADMGAGRNQIFFNGEPLYEARHPNRPGNGIFDHAMPPVTFDKKDLIRSPVFSAESNHWEGAWFLGYGHEAWSFQSARVVSSAGDELTLGNRSNPWFEKPMQGMDSSHTGEYGGGFLFGTEQCLDSAGEWILSGNTLTLIPPPGADPELDRVEMRVRQRTVDLGPHSHITLRGLRLTAGTVHIAGTGNLLVDCDLEWSAHFMSFPNGYAQDGGVPDGIALTIGGKGNRVHRCRISRTAAAGIVLKGASNTVSRCLIEDINYAGTYGSGITAEGTGHLVFFTTIRRTGRDCMQLEGQGGHRIFLNDFSWPGQLCKDVGIIYTFGTDGNGTRIAYNWVHDHPAPIPGPGIYLDNYVRNYQIDHNVIWNVPNDAGIRINAPALGHRIFNNTLFRTRPIGDFTYNQFPRFNPEPAFWTNKNMYYFETANNLFLGNNPEAQLVNPETQDFRLKQTVRACRSIKIDSGAGETNENSAGEGAYPFGRPPWEPGHEGHADPELSTSLGIPL